MSSRLEGKVAIVTGAARGQGEQTARLFASEGARVMLTDVLDDQLAKVAESIGKSARHMRHDVVSEAGWAAVVAETIATFGRVDVLINNAAISWFGKLTEASEADFHKVINVNLLSVFLGGKAVAPHMIAQKSGSIVNVSSVNGLRGTPGMSIYDASKWGVRGMSKSMANELGAMGIRVNSVHPGVIDTPMMRGTNGLDQENLMSSGEIAEKFMIGFGRIGEPSEVAAANLFLASDDASYINGAEIAVDGGWSAGPTLPKGSLDYY